MTAMLNRLLLPPAMHGRGLASNYLGTRDTSWGRGKCQPNWINRINRAHHAAGPQRHHATGVHGDAVAHTRGNTPTAHLARLNSSMSAGSPSSSASCKIGAEQRRSSHNHTARGHNIHQPPLAHSHSLGQGERGGVGAGAMAPRPQRAKRLPPSSPTQPARALQANSTLQPIYTRSGESPFALSRHTNSCIVNGRVVPLTRVINITMENLCYHAITGWCLYSYQHCKSAKMLDFNVEMCLLHVRVCTTATVTAATRPTNAASSH